MSSKNLEIPFPPSRISMKSEHFGRENSPERSASASVAEDEKRRRNSKVPAKKFRLRRRNGKYRFTVSYGLGGRSGLRPHGQIVDVIAHDAPMLAIFGADLVRSHLLQCSV